MLRIEGRVSATMIPAVWDRLLRLPTGFFARFSSGDLALRAMEFSKVFKKVSGAAVTTLVMGLFAFFNLALLFVYSWKMALVHHAFAGHHDSWSRGFCWRVCLRYENLDPRGSTA